MVAVERLLRKRVRTSLRRAVGWLLLGVVLASLIGVPIPQRKRVAGDAPFPCQDHPCGCGTAEACWQHCCCFSDSEKLNWAREHGVTPPEHVVWAARASTIPASAACRDPSGCDDSGCDDSKVARANRPSCCSESPPKDASEDTAEASATVVLIEAYKQCRGLASIFEQLTESWTAPGVPRVRVCANLLYLIVAIDQWPIERPQAPEPPVP